MHPLAEWEQANPGTVHDPEWFRSDVLPRLATVKLSEIVEAAGCSKASHRTSGEGSGRRTRVDVGGAYSVRGDCER